MADKNYFEKVKASESAGKTNAKNKQSSASGLYQFTKGTWEGLGYNWNDRFNPKLQEEAMIKYTQKADDQFTKALGRKPTDADRYGNHFLGAGTYIKALKAGDNALISNVVSSAAYNANKSVMQKNGKPITVGELKNWLNKKMGSTTTEVSQTSEQEEQTPYINPIDFNTPEYSGMTFSEEEPEQEQTPQEQSLQASKDLLEESFLEEADAMLAQSQTQQEQPVQEYTPIPQYNVELNPIEYQPIAQFQDGGEKNSLWKNIRANRGSGRKPTKEMLEQERKIKSKQDGGEIPISSRGMYEFKNENVIVPTSGMITMKNIPHNILGTSLETGETKLMTPNNKYFFKDTQTVLETPL